MVARGSWWLATIVLLLLGIGLWSLARAPEGPELPAGASAPIRPTPGESTAVSAVGESAAMADAGLAAAQREAVMPAVIAGPHVQVRVVDVDGVDAVGIEVAYVDTGKTDRGVAIVGADGIVRWPWIGRESAYWRCVASRGVQFGELYIPMSSPATTLHELRLQHDRNFVVQVFDAEHRAAAVVALRASYVATEGYRTSYRLGVTDAAGLLTAEHAQLWSHQVAARGTVRLVVVGADLPGIDVGREIDANLPPPEPVVLQLPPTGVIEVTVHDAFGAPRAGERVAIRENLPGEKRAHQATSDATGVARFPWVGLGPSWRIIRNQVPPDRWPVFTGPRVAHEVVKVVLQPDPVPVLIGQVQRDGAPVAKAKLVVETGGSRLGDGEVRTDDLGRFRVVLPAGWRDRHLTELAVCSIAEQGGFVDGSARWRGDLVVAVGVHDLGVLTLMTEPVAVAGQFVTEGAPPGAPPDEVRFGVQAATGSGTDPWQSVPLHPRREPDGRFSLSGMLPQASLRLSVTTRNQFLPVPPVPFVAGARDLRIELRRGGSVRASIVVGGPIVASCMQPVLLPMAGAASIDAQARWVRGLDPRLPNGRSVVADDPLEQSFTWPAVVPGRYRLEVRTRGVHTPFLVIPDVVVVDGERNEEARLQHLVVPGLQAIELTLPQAAVGGFGLGVVAVLDGDQPGELCWQVDNQMVLLAAVQPLDVLVRLHGFRDRIVRGLTSNQTIELQPGIPATLRPEGYTLPPEHTLRLELEAVDDVLARGEPQLYSAAAGGQIPGYRRLAMAGEWAAGAVLLRLPTPGRYRVTAELRAVDGKTTALGVDPAELAIGEAGGTFPLQLRTPR